MALTIGEGGGSNAANEVSLAGMISNPQFDSRVGRVGAVNDRGEFTMISRDVLRRGYMYSEKPPGGGTRPYLLNFQYNPTSFSHSSSVQADIPVLGGDDGGSGQGEQYLTFAASTGQSVNFSLLFDRTYETWDRDGTSAASKQGCLVDIKVLYGMLGMYSGATKAAGDASSNPINLDTVAPSAPLQPVPSWLQFSPLLRYYGYVAAVDVAITHFTQRMVPVRAAVSINFAVLPAISSAASFAESTAAKKVAIGKTNVNGRGFFA